MAGRRLRNGSMLLREWEKLRLTVPKSRQQGRVNVISKRKYQDCPVVGLAGKVRCCEALRAGIKFGCDRKY